eukprot:PhM_4_TR13354/c7_g1_i2/m.14075
MGCGFSTSKDDGHTRLSNNHKRHPLSSTSATASTSMCHASPSSSSSRDTGSVSGALFNISVEDVNILNRVSVSRDSSLPSALRQSASASPLPLSSNEIQQQQQQQQQHECTAPSSNPSPPPTRNVSFLVDESSDLAFNNNNNTNNIFNTERRRRMGSHNETDGYDDDDVEEPTFMVSLGFVLWLDHLPPEHILHLFPARPASRLTLRLLKLNMKGLETVSGLPRHLLQREEDQRRALAAVVVCDLENEEEEEEARSKEGGSQQGASISTHSSSDEITELPCHHMFSTNNNNNHNNLTLMQLSTVSWNRNYQNWLDQRLRGQHDLVVCCGDKADLFSHSDL